MEGMGKSFSYRGKPLREDRYMPNCESWPFNKIELDLTNSNKTGKSIATLSWPRAVL